MLVLDTHIWIWWINQTPKRLPAKIVKLIEQADHLAIFQEVFSKKMHTGIQTKAHAFD